MKRKNRRRNVSALISWTVLMETARNSISTTGNIQFATLVIPHAVKIKNGVLLQENIILRGHVVQNDSKLVIRYNVRPDRDRFKYLVRGFIHRYTILNFYQHHSINFQLKMQPNDIQQETDKTPMDTEIKKPVCSGPKKTWKEKKRNEIYY